MNHIQNATIELAGSVKYNGTTPLDAKLLVDTKADLKAIDSEYDYAIGDLVYCKEDNSYYQFNPAFSEVETGFFKKVYISTEAPAAQGEDLTSNPLVLTAEGNLVGGMLQATLTERNNRASGSITFANFINSLPLGDGLTLDSDRIALNSDTAASLAKIAQLEEKIRQLEESQVVPEEKDEILVTTMEEFNRLKEAGELTQEVIFIKEV